MGEEGSGSQVVALDEEEADEGAATVARRSRPAHLEEEAGDIDDLLADDVVDEIEDEEEVAPRRAPATVAAAPANWGVLPVVGLVPCVLFMAVVGIMSFELLHNMWGYKQPYKPTAFVTKALANLFDQKIPE